MSTSARTAAGIKDSLRNGLKESMKAKDSNTSTVIRSILSEISYSEKESADVDENKTLKLVQKAIARRVGDQRSADLAMADPTTERVCSAVRSS